MTQVICACQNLLRIVCFSFIYCNFFPLGCVRTCVPSVMLCVCVCRAEALSCMAHSGFTLAPVLSPWQQISHCLRCQLSTAFHTTCNICSLLTRVTTLSKTAWATKYHISLCCRETYRKFHLHIVSSISETQRKPTFYCTHCSKVWLRPINHCCASKSSCNNLELIWT